MKRQFVCDCYLQRNIFLKNYKLHVHFVDESQFRTDYAETFGKKGLKEDISYVIQQVKEVVQRRGQDGARSAARKELIAKSYVSLHEHVYRLQESFLHPEFLRIVDIAKKVPASKSSLMQAITSCKASSVYSFPVFTEEFCRMFLEELNHFEKCDLPKGRPSNMNTMGLLLYELGFYPHFFDPLREKYLMPLAAALYPDWTGVSGLDSQRAFVTSYDHAQRGEATELALHFDNAEVTLNVSLTDTFQGGELFFSGMRQEPHKPYRRVDHQKTRGVLHRGQHLHGAMPIECGERHNLIVWMRSSSIRNQLCPRCDKRPTLVETPGDGDGFTMNEC